MPTISAPVIVLASLGPTIAKAVSTAGSVSFLKLGSGGAAAAGTKGVTSSAFLSKAAGGKAVGTSKGIFSETGKSLTEPIVGSVSSGTKSVGTTAATGVKSVGTTASKGVKDVGSSVSSGTSKLAKALHLTKETEVAKKEAAFAALIPFIGTPFTSNTGIEKKQKKKNEGNRMLCMRQGRTVKMSCIRDRYKNYEGFFSEEKEKNIVIEMM